MEHHNVGPGPPYTFGNDNWRQACFIPQQPIQAQQYLSQQLTEQQHVMAMNSILLSQQPHSSSQISNEALSSSSSGDIFQKFQAIHAQNNHMKKYDSQNIDNTTILAPNIFPTIVSQQQYHPDAFYQYKNISKNASMLYPGHIQYSAMPQTNMNMTNVASTSVSHPWNSVYHDHRQTLILPNCSIDTVSMSSSSSDDSDGELENVQNNNQQTVDRKNELSFLRNLSRKKYNKLKRKSEVLTLSSDKNSAAEAMEVLKNVDLSNFERNMDSNDTKTQIFYQTLIQRILYGKDNDISPQLRENLSEEDIAKIEKIKNCDRETLKNLVTDFNNKQILLEQSTSQVPPIKVPKTNVDIDKFLQCDTQNESALRERLLLQILQSNNSVVVTENDPPSMNYRSFIKTPVQLLLKEDELVTKMIENRSNEKVKKIDPKDLAFMRKKVSKGQSKLHILRTKSKLTNDNINKNFIEMQALQAQLDQCIARIDEAKHRKLVYDQDIQTLNPIVRTFESNLEKMEKTFQTQKNYSSMSGEWNSSKFVRNFILHIGLCDIEFFRLCSFAFLKPHASIKKFSEIKFCDRYEKMFRNTLQLPNRTFNDSQLEHFKFYRLSSKSNISLFDDHWSNSINPQQILCKYELLHGQCNDKNCLYQHRKDFVMSDEEKLMDLYSYFKPLRNELDYNHLMADPHAEMVSFLKKMKSKYKIMDNLKNEKLIKHFEEKFRKRAEKGSLVESFIIRPFPIELFKHTDMKRDCAFLQEYDYRFVVLDETFILKPKLYFHRNYDGITFSRRFFASEQQEKEEIHEILKLKDPIRTFRIVKLAYSFIIEKREFGIVSAIDSAMLVLKRSFDSGVRNSEICSHFIRFYRIKLKINVEFNLGQKLIPFDIFCKKMLQLASYYDVWIIYLKSVETLQEKAEITEEIINVFIQNRMLYDANDFEKQKSRNIIEIILYRIHLFICQDNHEEGIRYFVKYFQSKNEKTLNEHLTSGDRVFLWLCFIHYTIFKTLPHEHFDHSKQSNFRHLNNPQTFLFDFRFLQENMSIVFQEIVTLFHNALEQCCPKFDKNTGSCLAENCNCQALRHNLVELLSVHQNDIVNFKNLLKLNTDLSFIYLDKIFSITLTNSIDMNLLTESFTSCMPAESSLELVYMKNYLYAFYSNKFDLMTVAKSFLVKNLFLLFDGCEQFDGSKKQYDESQDDIYKKVFDTVLIDQALSDSIDLKYVDLVSKILPTRLERSKNSVHFQLSYIFYSSLLITQNERCKNFTDRAQALDRCYQLFISSIEISNVETKLIYFWIGYMSILLQFKDIGSEEHFCFVYEKLRLICSKFNQTDPNLIFHLVCHFGKFIKRNERIDYYIEMSRFCTCNSSLIMRTLHLSYETQKDKCYSFISELILQKGIRLNLFSFWSIAICLAVDRSDHLIAHKFFQLALLTMPFDKELLRMMKSYEVAVGHEGHVKALQEHCRINHIIDV